MMMPPHRRTRRSCSNGVGAGGRGGGERVPSDLVGKGRLRGPLDVGSYFFCRRKIKSPQTLASRILGGGVSEIQPELFQLSVSH